MVMVGTEAGRGVSPGSVTGCCAQKSAEKVQYCHAVLPLHKLLHDKMSLM